MGVSRRSPRGTSADQTRTRLTSRRVLTAAITALALLGMVAVGLLLEQRAAPTEPAPISSVATQDVHSLAFLGSSERIVLGHHGGILESKDGGKTWSAWGTGVDAMAIGVAGADSIIVAGHGVLALGSPEGRWTEIVNDLPNMDIHGFARDLHDPARMWAYLAAGGVYESRDDGSHWTEVFGGHALGLSAVARGDATRLVAVDPERGAVVASDDGGRTWQATGTPPSTPIYAMAGTASGDTILLSGSEGVFRSEDGGGTFARLINVGQPILAIAVTDEGNTIVLASRDRSIYRSDDRGLTWAGN